MKKVTLISSLVLAGVVLNIAAPAALAKDWSNEPYPHAADAKATVKFTKGETTDPGTVTPPVNPPVGPTDPIPPNVGTGGAVALSVPGMLDFGSTEISDSSIELNAKLGKLKIKEASEGTAAGTEVTFPSMFVVKDIRGDENGSWALSVGMTEEFTSRKSGTVQGVLAGAYVSLQGQAYNSRINGLAVKGSDVAADFTIKDEFKIEKGAPKMFMDSKNGSGRGETTYIADSRYDATKDINQYNALATEAEKVNDGIKLYVPSSAVKDVFDEGYEATFTWSIMDTAETTP